MFDKIVEGKYTLWLYGEPRIRDFEITGVRSLRLIGASPMAACRRRLSPDDERLLAAVAAAVALGPDQGFKAPHPLISPAGQVSRTMSSAPKARRTQVLAQ